MRPPVSALVLSWNGGEMLGSCLASLVAQDVARDALEIVVWDNGSRDGSSALTRSVLADCHRPHRVIESAENLGFAAGCNRALLAASGEHILLVNQDVELAPDYVALLSTELDRDPSVAAVQGAILRADRRTIDSLGQYPDMMRRCVERGANRPFEAFADEGTRDAFSVCAAAAMYRRSALEQVALACGPFDEDFHTYYEDIDLGWRLRRAGYRARVLPAAQAYHARGGSFAMRDDGRRRMLERLSPDMRLAVLRNRLYVIGRNESFLGLLVRLPAIVAWEAALFTLMTRTDRRTLRRHLRALPDTLRRAWRKRREKVRPRGRSPVIAIVITKLELGGAQQVALEVAAELRRRGVAVLFVTGHEGLLRPACESIPGLSRYFLRSLRREVRPLSDACALLTLARILRRHRPDIVHTHSSKAGILGRVAARLSGVPHAVHTVHGFPFHDRQAPIVRKAYVAMERLASRLTSRFVVVSRENLAGGTACRVLDPGRAVLIRAGVDLELFADARVDVSAKRAELGIPEGDLVVGTVACLKPQKAPLHFVQVAERIRARRPATSFVMVGDGELRARVRGDVDRRGLSDRIHLLGWREDVPLLLRTFDLFLLTSLWEGLPMVLPQARAAGVPIVATSVNGNGEAVRDGTSGLLCPPGDLDALAAACLSLLEDPGRRREMALAAREGLEEFSRGEMLARHVALYEDILGRALEPARGEE